MISAPAIRNSATTLALVLMGCGGGNGDPQPAQTDAPADVATASPQDAFWAHLESLCGRAFPGEATLASGDGFDGQMIMHVRSCEDDEIQIPLHVGENRSRTWIVTRTLDGLRLKHDHRVEDGSDDPVTQYGGDTRDAGTATHQSFHADPFTAELIPDAVTNVWSMTIDPGVRFVYHLTRHDAPRATFTFDLSQEVDAPPPPWGYEGT